MHGLLGAIGFAVIQIQTFLKPLDTFWTEQKLKVHSIKNNLQGLQKVIMKDFPWNDNPWNALLFEKTLKHWSILDIENKHMSWHGETIIDCCAQVLSFF